MLSSKPSSLLASMVTVMVISPPPSRKLRMISLRRLLKSSSERSPRAVLEARMRRGLGGRVGAVSASAGAAGVGVTL